MVTVILMAGCGGGGPAGDQQLSGRVALDGSSTVYPISEAVAEEFRSDSPAVRVTVGISGTGGGFKKFVRKEVDISNASRPIKASEATLAREEGVEFIELPVAYDGIAVVVHPDNDWCDSVTVRELKRMWEPAAQNTIMRWNQIRPEWPDEKLTLFGAGVDSGTYDYFTQAIVGQEGASRGDFISSEDDNVLVQGVSGDLFALGFFGFAYYEENQSRLKLVGVDDEDPTNGEGPVKASIETVAKGTYQPLSRPIFIYVRRESADRPEVARFIEFYLKHAAELVREVGYISLPEKAYQLALQRFQNRTTGSVFETAGSQVGVSVEDLLSRESGTPE